MISYHTMSYHIISYHIISCHIISCHIISYHIISYHIISYNIISYHIISYHIISYHITSQYLLLLFCSILIIVSALLFSPTYCGRNSDPGAHTRLVSPLPARVRALHFYREKTLALSSLVGSRRIVPTHDRRSQQLFILLHFGRKQNKTKRNKNSKSHHGGIRTSGQNTINSCIRA